MEIPFLDLKAQYQTIKKEVHKKIEEVCEDSAFSDGTYVKEFENSFVKYCSAQNVIALNSGTSALHLAMITLGIGRGDEVILPANTFISTAWAPAYVGATPVFVDCCLDTWEIDPLKIEEKITRKTKAIIGVHLYGQPFDIDSVKELADSHGLFLIEDAAQAHGAKYKGERVGGFGEMACFSFYPGKNLGTYGEGGCITTNNLKYDKHLRSLRNHGSYEKYYHDEVGFNMRMGGIEGAVLHVKLKYLDQWNKKRKEIAVMYQEGISNSCITMQKQPKYADSVYHLFVIKTKDRNGLMKYLNEHGIYPGMHYPVPCHLQKSMQKYGYKLGDYPISEELSDTILSLPIYPELIEKQIRHIIDIVNSFN